MALERMPDKVWQVRSCAAASEAAGEEVASINSERLRRRPSAEVSFSPFDVPSAVAPPSAPALEVCEEVLDIGTELVGSSASVSTGAEAPNPASMAMDMVPFQARRRKMCDGDMLLAN
mmetsp:Transcript_20024/g.43562  ORF Transcript_20024/g.43562 Transcript_20024/m.43562 type:complete len:118 (-) Transcript_20024:101-454(-)